MIVTNKEEEFLDLTEWDITTETPGHFEMSIQEFWTFMRDDCTGLKTSQSNKGTLCIDFEVYPGTEVVKGFVRYFVKSGKLFSVKFDVTKSNDSRVPVELHAVQAPAVISIRDPQITTFGGCPMYMERSWLNALSEVLKTKDFQNLSDSIKRQRSEVNGSDFRLVPASENVFAWTWACDFDRVKVVILGQDPYPGKDVAHGLAFSVMPDQKPIPDSLQNIYKELENEGFVKPKNGYLMGWARQGVLLLNAVLTLVDWENKLQRDPRSKQQKEDEKEQRKLWETFTDAVIELLCQRNEGLVFMLWGREAQKKKHIIEENMKGHTILEASHPSNQSAYLEFNGCGHFQECDEVLSEGKIDWEMKYEY